jgi:hypothetical protein
MVICDSGSTVGELDTPWCTSDLWQNVCSGAWAGRQRFIGKLQRHRIVSHLYLHQLFRRAATIKISCSEVA